MISVCVGRPVSIKWHETQRNIHALLCTRGAVGRRGQPFNAHRSPALQFGQANPNSGTRLPQQQSSAGMPGVIVEPVFNLVIGSMVSLWPEGMPGSYAFGVPSLWGVWKHALGGI
jgi:hypothetical protein